MIVRHNLLNNLCFKSILGFEKTRHTKFYIYKGDLLHALKICRLLNSKLDTILRIVTSLLSMWMNFDVSSVRFIFDGFDIDRTECIYFSWVICRLRNQQYESLTIIHSKLSRKYSMIKAFLFCSLKSAYQ